MKKILLMCCFLLGISAVSFAQGGGMRRSPEEQAKDLKEQLKLSDDQTAKVTAIFQSQAKSRDSLRTAANGDRQAMMQGFRTMMVSTNAKIEAVLTADQKAAYQKLVQERMNRMGQGGGTPSPSQK